MSNYEFSYSTSYRDSKIPIENAEIPDVTIVNTNKHSYTHFNNYQVEKDGAVISPTINCFLHEYRIWFWDAQSTVYESKFVIINEFLFVKIEAADLDKMKDKPTRYFLVLSGPEERTLTHNDLLSEKHSVELKLTNDTYESALQIELVDGSKRWLFAHPDGQRAAQQELDNTSSEDDLLRIEDSKQ